MFITLSGVDDRGNRVSVTAVTDSNANYSFGNLRTGEYTLTESQPEGQQDGAETPGSLGGDVGGDGYDFITNIQVKAIQYGVG